MDERKERKDGKSSKKGKRQKGIGAGNGASVHGRQHSGPGGDGGREANASR